MSFVFTLGACAKLLATDEQLPLEHEKKVGTCQTGGICDLPADTPRVGRIDREGAQVQRANRRC